jgi:sugar (pentulose or hexulose) kinase
MILALDVGTTAVKAAVVSAQGELLAWDCEPQPLLLAANITTHINVNIN